MNWLDYRKVLGIGFDDQDKIEYFTTKIFNILDDISQEMRCAIDDGEYYKFCNITGTVMRHGALYGREYEIIVNVLREKKKSLTEFLAYYAAFVNSLEENDYRSWTKESFKKLVCNILEQSHIPFEMLEDEDGVFIFPKGAKELDKALVSEPLEWLHHYPNAYKTFCIALKQYSEGIYIRDVADNLRKSLEAFLQEFLCNTKNLETNKSEICKYLGEQGVDGGISGLFHPLINSYKNINDRIAKHNDAVDEKVLEFLLYQTGILIRMVITVKASEGKQ